MTFKRMVDSIKKRSNFYKIVVVGLDNAGKTSILMSVLGGNPLVPPTFGYSVYNVKLSDIIGTSQSQLTILDIGGQSLFKKYWSNYFEDVDGAVFIFDCSDDRNFSDYLNTVLDLNVPVCILANKIDLNPSFDLSDKFNFVGKNCKAFKTSIFDIENIKSAFGWLINTISTV